MPTIVCTKCGFENPDRNKFCQNCGFNFANASANAGVNTTIQIPKTESESSAWENISDRDIAAMSLDLPITSTTSAAATTETINPANQAEIGHGPIAVDVVDGVTTETESTIAPSDPAIPPATTDEDTGSVNTDDVKNISNPGDRADANDLEARTASPSEQLTDRAATEPDNPTLPLDLEISEAKTQKSEIFSISYAGLTDVGQQRDHNEDNFAIGTQIATTEMPDRKAQVTSRGLFILCDGMGGHAGGEVASSMAIQTIMEMFRPFWINKLPGIKTLREIIHVANQAIYDRNEIELRRDAGRMGTTLVLLANYENEVAIAHVGDSRIYQVTATELKQITRDHEVANRLIDQGIELQEAMSRHDAHQLTQALGPYANSQVDPGISFLRVSEPTLFLLCSDGLCDNDLVEQNWETHLLPLLAGDADLKSGVRNLINLGNTINGHDNITAILIRCQFEQ
ncbi:serine/threonine phosphatase [Pseudanabaena sp. PCC 6802]|uniref:serine/threonine phosphatase n=1 Tax=Pseudanabaena sp. PCC 6802 TaxID=118173 RepID=UPI000347365E|nr:serine/threonine phosphatase [Pseudanabaena sp. PCC 6802]